LTYVSTLRAIIGAAALSAVAGCGALTALGDVSTPLDVYELRSPSDLETRQGRRLPVDLTVEVPTTSGALETDRIMIRPGPLQAEYLPGARWGEVTPVMVQTLLLRSIEASQGVRYVARRPLGASGDYAIVTELTDFQAELNPDGETAEVKLQFISRIVRESDALIVATRTFSSSSSASSVETQMIVEAFDSATGRLLAEFSEWVLSTLKGR